MTDRCDAYHDGHDCRQPGACSRALVAMCERIDAQSIERGERQTQHREDPA